MELSEEQKVMFETVVSESFQSVLQNMLTPVVNLELLKRKEALTEKEVDALYGISANTLRTKRARGGGPTYRQGPERGNVLYTHKDIVKYLENIKKRT